MIFAKGVEAGEQAAKLNEMGFDLAQSYYFADPLHGEVAERQSSRG
jgi:EAL domain-containing protein (putative c-di-GMP-specific phosphodiesterase class I)